MKLAVSIFLTLLLIPSTGFSQITQFVNGERLSDLIRKSEKDKGAQAIVMSYVMGVLDADKVVRHYLKSPQAICVPADQGNDAVQEVKNYLQRTSNQQQISGSYIVINALYKKYPC